MEFYGFCIFQIGGFLRSEIESRKTFLENAKIIPCSLFEDVYGDERQKRDPFSHFAPKTKVIHVFKAKSVVFREEIRAKVRNDSFLLILSR